MPYELKNVEQLGEKCFDTGEIILKEGERGKDIFVLSVGEVSVSACGKEICRVEGNNSFFGEISCFLDTEYSATVRAETDCVFYIIDDIEAYMKANPDAALCFTQGLAERLIEMNKHFVEIKGELENLKESVDSSFKSRVNRLIEKMDSFWGTEVFPNK